MASDTQIYAKYLMAPVHGVVQSFEEKVDRAEYCAIHPPWSCDQVDFYERELVNLNGKAFATPSKFIRTLRLGQVVHLDDLLDSEPNLAKQMEENEWPALLKTNDGRYRVLKYDQEAIPHPDQYLAAGTENQKL